MPTEGGSPIANPPLLGLVLSWLLLALGSFAAPWFIVFAVAGWIAAPLLALAGASLLTLAARTRPHAGRLASAAGLFVLVTVLPSAVVVAVALSRMSDDYF